MPYLIMHKILETLTLCLMNLHIQRWSVPVVQIILIKIIYNFSSQNCLQKLTGLSYLQVINIQWILTIFSKRSTFDVLQGSKYPSGAHIWSIRLSLRRSSQWRCSVKKVFLKISQNSQENTCARVCARSQVCNLIKEETQVCNFIKKETLALVSSCEFWENFKKPFFTEHLWWLLLFTECVMEKQSTHL